jgi:hypothetical protein
MAKHKEVIIRNLTLTLLSRSYRISFYERKGVMNLCSKTQKDAHNNISSQGLQNKINPKLKKLS